MLILIDALNEGENKELWSSQLVGTLEKLSQFKNISLAFTCRSSYVKLVLGKTKVGLTVEHRGLKCTLRIPFFMSLQWGEGLNPECWEPYALRRASYTGLGIGIS